MERPPKPPRADRPRPVPPPLAWLRRPAKRALLQAIDHGWFGMVPLDLHLVMCGFPRSGTTLLQLMAETAFPEARSFNVERSGLGAAQNDWPGRHPMLITKRPDDIFWIDEIRDAYAWRGTRTRVRFIVSVRDPRAVLTSVHNNDPSNYWVPVDRWRAIYAHLQYVRRSPDVTVVEYRDVVERPSDVQRAVETLCGRRSSRSFDQFHAAVPESFDTRALNGVRPLDTSTLNKWRAPKHRARIQQLLEEMPELPDRLVEMGYEPDHEWCREYR